MSFFKFLTATLVASFAFAPGVAIATALRCDIAQKFVCENTGCRTIAASTRALIDLDKNTYARCDSRGCDTYEAYIYRSGAFLNIEVPGRHSIAKMAAEDAPAANLRAFSFHEVATQMHAVLISFGSCQKAVTPSP